MGNGLDSKTNEDSADDSIIDAIQSFTYATQSNSKYCLVLDAHENSGTGNVDGFYASVALCDDDHSAYVCEFYEGK